VTPWSVTSCVTRPIVLFMRLEHASRVLFDRSLVIHLSRQSQTPRPAVVRRTLGRRHRPENRSRLARSHMAMQRVTRW
jgi:hypothetical protein